MARRTHHRALPDERAYQHRRYTTEERGDAPLPHRPSRLVVRVHEVTDAEHLYRSPADRSPGREALIRDDDVPLGKHLDGAPRRLQHRQVCEQQVVVDHQHVRLRQAGACLVVEALRLVRARRAEALVVPDRERRPDRPRGQCLQLALVPSLRVLEPLPQRVEPGTVLDLLRGVQGAHPGSFPLLDLVVARVVPPTLHQAEREGPGQGCTQCGEIFLDQLLLEPDGRRDHQDLLLGDQRVPDRRHQGGVALPHSRGCLDEQVLAGTDGAVDLLRHADLWLARSVAGQHLRQRPSDFEHSAYAQNRVSTGCHRGGTPHISTRVVHR